MSSYTNLNYHIIFSTKYRRRVLVDPIRESLYEYIGGILRVNKGRLIEIGGVADHVHILAQISATTAVSDAIRDLKANSSKWFNESSGTGSRFEWQKGYAAFTVSFSQIKIVRRYIRNQEEHHRQQSFQEEYIEFLERHQIAYRPEYLFEDEHHG